MSTTKILNSTTTGDPFASDGGRTSVIQQKKFNEEKNKFIW